MSERHAVVLLSGGIDSTVALHWYASAHGPGAVLGLFVDYGQLAAEAEFGCAARACHRAGAELWPVQLARAFPGSPLTSEDGPKGPSVVPGRNGVLAWLGLAQAEAVGALDVVLGATRQDVLSYPDCRSSFVDSVNASADAAGIRARIAAPFLGFPKTSVVGLGGLLGVDWGDTVSCYAPREGAPCGACDSCLEREHAFRELGVKA